MANFRSVLFATLLMFSIDPLRAQSYEQQLQRWYEHREEELKAPNGWLNLVGLLWLQEGENSFGSDSYNAIVFPTKIAGRAGSFIRKGTKVWLEALAPITVNDAVLSRAQVFDADAARNPVMQLGDLRWNIIKREDKIGIRLRDLNHPAVKDFSGIEHFPVDRNFLIKAKYEPHMVPTTVSITNILGQTTQQFSPGVVYFQLDGKAYQMIALEEEGQLFFVFGDLTNDVETYPAGRFLKAEKPPGPGEVWLDFNKAYNPPCAFTPFATCPLPPRQNIFDRAIKAGEKNYSTHH